MKQNRTALVTGASRGIGLGFARQMLARGDRVVAAVRTVEAPALVDLQEAHPERLVRVTLDLQDADTFASVADDLKARGLSLDLLVHNAGIFAEGEEGLETLEREKMIGVLDVNVLGPLLLTKALLPLLNDGALVAALTSGSGQPPRERKDPGGQYSYGLTKAALYFALSQLDADLFPRGINTIGIGPGFVRTDMTAGSPVQPPLSVDESVAGMLKVFDGITREDSGRYFSYAGSVE